MKQAPGDGACLLLVEFGKIVEDLAGKFAEHFRTIVVGVPDAGVQRTGKFIVQR